MGDRGRFAAGLVYYWCSRRRNRADASRSGLYRHRGVLVVLSLLFVGILFALWLGWEHISGPNAQDERNCDDFDSQAEAQRWMREQWERDRKADPDGLDGPIGPTSDGLAGVACDNPGFNYPNPETDYNPVLFDDTGQPTPPGRHGSCLGS